MDVNGNDNSPEWGWCKHEGCKEEAFPIWLAGEFPDDPDLLLCPTHIGLHIGAATREAAQLRQTLMSVRKDVHFAHVTVYSEGKWDALCTEIKRQIDEVIPNGTAGARFLEQLNHAAAVIRDLQDKMLPVNEYVARLESACREALLYFDMLSDPEEQAGDMLLTAQRIDAERAIRDALPPAVHAKSEPWGM